MYLTLSQPVHFCLLKVSHSWIVRVATLNTQLIRLANLQETLSAFTCGLRKSNYWRSPTETELFNACKQLSRLEIALHP